MGQVEADGGEVFWEQMGYAGVGPLLESMARWVAECAEESGCERVFFLARDGWGLWKAYESLRSRGGPGPESYYLLASRRCFNFAAIRELNAADMEFLTSGFRGIGMLQILNRLGWEAESVDIRGLPAAISTDDERRSVGNWLLQHKRRIVEQAEKERAALMVYLKGSGWPESGRTGLVDIGWRGSLQESLHRLCGPGTMLQGHYFGLLPEARQRVVVGESEHQAFAFLYGEPNTAYRTARICIELIEFLFSNDSPSLQHFESADGGDACAVWGTDHPDDASRAALRSILVGCERYLEERGGLEWNEPGPVDGLAWLWRLLREPTIEEARCIGEIKFDTGFGGQPHYVALAKPESAGHYLRHPLQLLDDDRRALWRAGFRRQFLQPVRAFLNAHRPVSPGEPRFERARPRDRG